jgi:hypothetical protein
LAELQVLYTLEHILSAAREYRIPDWYIQRLDAFRA